MLRKAYDGSLSTVECGEKLPVMCFATRYCGTQSIIAFAPQVRYVQSTCSLILHIVLYVYVHIQHHKVFTQNTGTPEANVENQNLHVANPDKNSSSSSRCGHLAMSANTCLAALLPLSIAPLRVAVPLWSPHTYTPAAT